MNNTNQQREVFPRRARLSVLRSIAPRHWCCKDLLTVVCLGLILQSAALGQEFSPPPGFSPAAPPPPARITSESEAAATSSSGFLQRFGGNSGSRQVSGTASQGLPPADDTRAPAPRSSTGSSGNWQPPAEQHPVYLAPSVAVPRWWLKAEALYWWTQDSPLPVPLVTTGSTGILGQPDTSVLMGNESLELPGRGGGRFTLGFALDPEAIWALEGNFFFLSTATVSEGVSSNGSPGSAPLFVPYFNPVTGTESATYIASPGYYSGTAVLTLQNYVQGAEANVLYQLSNSGAWRWDGLAGFRYFNLHETLSFMTDSPAVFPNPPDFFSTYDDFNVQNNFYGGQLGARVAYENPWIFFNGTARLALGATWESVSTAGGLSSSYGSAPGGYFTQPSNLGSITQSQFAVIPGVDLNFGIRLAPWASVVVGYSFLYVSSVARPGEQIDHAINPSQSPLAFGPSPPSGIASPALVVRSTDFWVQGLTFSLELRF